MVLGEVLQLDEPACPAARAVGSVKLEHPTASAVLADSVLHGLVLSYAALSKLEAQGEHLGQVLWRFLYHGGNFLFAKALRFQTVLCQISLHLHHGVGILQTGLFLHGLHQGGFR